MKKLLILILMMVSTISFAQVQKDPFPSNWKQLQGSDGNIQIFPLLPDSYPTSYPSDLSNPQLVNPAPPLMPVNYGMYNDVVQKWMNSGISYGFSFINMEDATVDPSIILSINNNEGKAFLSKNAKGNYSCYIPIQEQTSDFIKIEFTDEAFSSCNDQYAKDKALASYVSKPKTLTDAGNQTACLTPNKAMPNGSYQLPGRDMSDPIPHVSCGYPLGSPETKDVQVPLNQPFPDKNPIHVATKMGVNFKDLNKFCSNCSMNTSPPVPVIKIPTTWKMTTQQ